METTSIDPARIKRSRRHETGARLIVDVTRGTKRNEPIQYIGRGPCCPGDQMYNVIIHTQSLGICADALCCAGNHIYVFIAVFFFSACYFTSEGLRWPS